MSEVLPLNIRSSNDMRRVLGVSKRHFNIILNQFTSLHSKLQLEQYHKRTNRKRVCGGGRKSKLSSVADKLAFCLYYLKNYPTFAVFAHSFNMAQSTAHNNLALYMPLLRMALFELGVEPVRDFEHDEALSDYIKKGHWNANYRCH